MRRPVIAIAAVILAVAGCGKTPATPTTPATPATPAAGDGAVELRFWNGFTGPDGRTMLAIVRQFNAANPDVHVVMQRMLWGQYYNKLFVAGSGGRAPEVFVTHRSALQRFVTAGFVRPADDLFGNAPDQIDPTDIDANILAAVAQGGHHWAVPLDCHPLGMYYSRRLLKEAGFDHPPATRDEFVEVLKRLKPKPGASPRDATWGFAITWQRTNCYTLIRQWGGELFNADTTKATFASPPNVAAVDWMAGLIRDGLVPSPENFDDWIGFRQGRVGIVFEGIYMLPDLEKQTDLDWAAAPVPLLGEERAAWADSHSLVLRQDLDPPHLAAAKKFIKYLSDHSLDWAVGGQVPVRKSLRNSDRFRGMIAQSQFAKQIPYVAYFPPTPYIVEYQRAFDDAVELALRGTKSSQAALSDADRTVETVIQRYQSSYAAK